MRKISENSNPYSGQTELNLIENNCELYNASIASRINRSMPLDAKSIMDFGAGKGTLASILTKSYAKNVICVEVDPTLRKELQQKGFSTYKQVEDIKQNFDFIFSSNVIEHIENDQECIKKLYNKLNKNGVIFVYVPAFNLLFSEMDTKVGHFRRYRATDLRKLLENAGFKVVHLQYNDKIGFFLTLIVKYLKVPHNLTQKPFVLVVYDRILFRLSLLLDWLTQYKLFGKNISIVGIKK